MKFSWNNVKKPIVALAPMEGYTDSPFRQIVKKYAPDVICYTEFTSVNALKYNNPRSFKKISFTRNERPLIIQLFGNKIEHFTEIIPHIEEMGFSGIDINMGCPAKKVIAAQYGSALIKNPQLASEIVYQVSKSTKLPISVKTRLGFSEYDENKFFNFCKNIESAGAKLITVHGRTTKQGFSGEAKWNPIYEVKKILKIPVIGNGDINSPESALKKINNLDGIMVGRATFGSPLIMYFIYRALHNKPIAKKRLPDITTIAKMHIRCAVKMWEERNGMLKMRKHLLAYLKGFPYASKYREKISQVTTKKQAFSILDEIKKEML